MSGQTGQWQRQLIGNEMSDPLSKLDARGQNLIMSKNELPELLASGKWKELCRNGDNHRYARIDNPAHA